MKNLKETYFKNLSLALIATISSLRIIFLFRDLGSLSSSKFS
jgi:hypothetical protein